MGLVEKLRQNRPMLVTLILFISLLLSALGAFAFSYLYGFKDNSRLILETFLLVELVIAIFFLTIFKPAYGLSAIFAIELSLKNFHIGPASIRTILLLLVIGFFVWKSFIVEKRKIKDLMDFFTEPIIKFSVLFYLLHIITFTIIHSGSFDPNLMVRMFIGIFLLILCLSFLKTEKDVMLFLYTGIALMFISAVFAALQKHIGEPFLSLPPLLGEVDLEVLMEQSLLENRYTGIRATALRQAYDIVNIFPLLLAGALFRLNRQKKNPLNRIFIWVSSIIIFYALILTGTRSALTGILIGLAAATFIVFLKNKAFFRKLAKKLLAAVGILLVIAGIIFVFQIQHLKEINLRDSFSPKAKIPKFISGLKAYFENPLFGIGRIIVDPLESEDEIPSFLRKYSMGAGGGNVHNLFINSLLLGGPVRFILLIIFLSLIVIQSFSLLVKSISLKEKQKYIPLYFGYSVWIVAYILDKQVHNLEPFSDMVFWYILGSLMAMSSLFKRESRL